MGIFGYLGTDLTDLVCKFAFRTSYNDVKYSLKTYMQIKNFNLPRHFISQRLFSPKHHRFIPSPLIVFEPIASFDGYRSLFNWNEIYYVLWQLDFRRAKVKAFGSRGRWHLRLTLSWTAVLEFIIYYRELALITTPVYKPSIMELRMQL